MYKHGAALCFCTTVLAIISFCIFVLWPNEINIKCSEVEYKPHVVNCNDTVSYQKMVDDMWKLSERYREETSHMIDKGSAWNGFWLTIIFSIFGIFSFIQYKDHKDNSKRILCALRLFEAEKEKRLLELERETHVAKINTIAQCLLILPDAQMLSEDKHMKKYVKSYFVTMCETFDSYIKCLFKMKDINMLKDELDTVRLVITMMRNGISHTQTVIGSAETSIEFYQVNQEVKYLLQRLFSGVSNEHTIEKDLTGIAEKLAHLRIVLE